MIFLQRYRRYLCSWLLFGLLAFLLGISGCNKETSNEEDDSEEPWKGSFKTTVGSWEEFQQLVESHRGKVVVADLWSTWCEPCLEELPHLAELQKKYGDDVVCIGVNLDFNEPQGKPTKKTQKEVKQLFRKRIQTALNAADTLPSSFRLFISSTATEKVYGLAGIDTAIPLILVYSKTGERTVIDVNYADKLGDDELSYEKHVFPVVEKYLKEPAPSK